MSEELQTPGQVAYRAYADSRLEVMPEWDDLEDHQKRSWEAAGHAVVRATTKQL